MKFGYKALIIVALLVLLPCLSEGGQFIAYSLGAAEGMLKESSTPDVQVRNIAGMKDPVAVVYDDVRNDLILVGKTSRKEQKVTLDDFVVALRAKFKHKMFPQVSIDKIPETATTLSQVVNFEGGIAGTQIGKDLLRADVLLKKIGLGKISAEIWGIKSYFDLYAEHWQTTGEETFIESRFWFIPARESCVAGRRGVAVVKQLKIRVMTEVLSSIENQHRYDQIGDRFAEAFTSSYADVSAQFSELKRLNTIFKLVGIVEAIDELSTRDSDFKPRLTYWLSDYELQRVVTPSSYPLLISKKVLTSAGNAMTQTIDGGIRLENLMSDLKDGVATALRDIVILSRPEGNPLVWRVPLEGWSLPDALEMGHDALDKTKFSYPNTNRLGCSLRRTISPTGNVVAASNISENYRWKHVPSYGQPVFRFSDNLSSPRYSNIGGVMLSSSAKLSKNEDAKVDIAGGNFSFVVDGEKARLSPQDFRKFVTALWSVYYSKQDPGISIDPIAPGIDKHMIRYIGKVINNDLGRVMREADYLMKKWAVGTERPDIPGFKNPDDISARRGKLFFGSSRFWFVPENMRFKRAGDMLLFENGKMTVKTEFMVKNKSIQADPSNKKFAQFFTNHYQKIAEKYPIYRELFEYAKLVSLAKYLKEKGVPLYWFLMANKDLILTEDSPGTVNALVKGSNHFKGIQIEGGVNLGFEGNYVYDESAVQAINKAVSKLSASKYSKETPTSTNNFAKLGTEAFSFNLGKEGYTVVPQHSLTSGKDHRGIRYQTDLALRHNGQPGLEIVRYYNPKRQNEGQFGNGWHLLIPYRIRPIDNVNRQFHNTLIPEKMAVENTVTGDQELLSFSTDHYAIAGYVPAKLDSSHIVGLFIMSDATYRLADKLGNEFWFNQAGLLTDMIFSKDHHIHIEYLYNLADEFQKSPYHIEPAGPTMMDFLNVRIPKKMRIKDLIYGSTEELRFSGQGTIAGYLPVNAKKSRFKILALMSDASFRLLDKENNEIMFNPGGEFEGFVAASNRPIIKSISLGSQNIGFKYTMSQFGMLMIASAHFFQSKESSEPTYVVDYQYDHEGRLCRVDGSNPQVAEYHKVPDKKIFLAKN